MKLADLARDNATGQLSHTKVWCNVAYAAATAAFLKQSWEGTVTADIWFVYLGVVGAHTTISKFLSLRYGSKHDV